MFRNSRAFTLVEIAIVVTVLMVVAVYAIARLGDSRERSLQARAREDARQLQVAYERSLLANARYLTNESVPLFATNAFRNGLTSKMPAPESLSRIYLAQHTFITNKTALFMAGNAIASTNTSGTNSLPQIIDNFPVVTFTSPVADGTYYSGQSVPINVTVIAFYPITQVEFQDNGSIIGAASVSPYSLSHVFSAGAHTIKATATDNQGQTGFATRNITVIQSAPPNIALTATPSASTYPLNTSVALAATASAMQGSISKIDLYQDGTIIKTTNSVSLDHVWSTATPGTYTFLAKAYDTYNATNIAGLTFTFQNSNPSIFLTAPASVGYLDSIGFDTTVSDVDGYVVKVEYFYENAGVPFAISTNTGDWGIAENGSRIGYTANTAGTLHFHAIAYDELNGSATSETIAVNVAANQTPSITMTTQDSTNITGTTIALTATATDPNDGDHVTQVIFYDGVNPIATNNTPTGNVYTANFDVTLGTHSITARAYDTTGDYGLSGVIIVTGNVPLPSVAITAPIAGTKGLGPVDILCSATATTSSGTISSVQFYYNNTLIGSGTVAGSSYSYTWTQAPAGPYAIYAKAVNSLGGTSYSSTNVIIIPGMINISFIADTGWARFGTNINGTWVNTINVNWGAEFHAVNTLSEGKYFEFWYHSIVNMEYILLTMLPNGSGSPDFSLDLNSNTQSWRYRFNSFYINMSTPVAGDRIRIGMANNRLYFTIYQGNTQTVRFGPIISPVTASAASYTIKGTAQFQTYTSPWEHFVITP